MRRSQAKGLRPASSASRRAGIRALREAQPHPSAPHLAPARHLASPLSRVRFRPPRQEGALHAGAAQDGLPEPSPSGAPRVILRLLTLPHGARAFRPPAAAPRHRPRTRASSRSAWPSSVSDWSLCSAGCSSRHRAGVASRSVRSAPAARPTERSGTESGFFPSSPVGRAWRVTGEVFDPSVWGRQY